MVATERIRNVVLVGHNGNGKTSLAEALLYRAGSLERPGTIERGNTVMDHDGEEQQRQQSLSLSLASFGWRDHKVNLIDTPGHADYLGDAVMGMSVADLAVFVIDGVAGVQAQDVELWRHADAIGLPRLVFINKLDREHSSHATALAGVQQAFGSHLDPVELPIGEQVGFHGVVDVITDRAFVYDSGHAEPAPIPEGLADAERAEHDHLVEEVIEMDDDLLEQYLDGNEPSHEKLERLLHDAVDAAKVFPVLCGSATTPIGADYLIDFICQVGPAPGDCGPTIVEAGDEAVEVAPDAAGDPLVFVFKTTNNEFLGQLSYVKMISGTVRTDDVLVGSRGRSKERLHQLLTLSGGAASPVSEITAGDMAAVAKLSDVHTGDTLAPDGKPVRVPAPDLPRAVFGIAIAAKKRSEEDRLAMVLRRLVDEDPTLSVRHDDDTHQTVLSGRGETHLRVALARIEGAGVEVETDDVRVAYRETLAGSVEVEGRYKKQTGGHGQFGVATVRFEPLDRGAGFEFDSEVTGGAIPRNLIPAVGAGVEESMRRGGVYGFPIVDVRAVCTDGKHHSVDSSEMSFKMAGSLALREAVSRVGVEVLEPISEIAVRVPSRHHGDVLGDLNSRRAQVLGTTSGADDLATINALVPTSEIVRYAIDLRSLTGGTASFEVDHHGYQPMPQHLVDKLERTHGDD
ncbi:MAG: elongation factor G [Ilumatobacter sp.]|nr:elongation factor G [Ilumatobacter sp.]